MKPSKYQKAIYNAFQETNENITKPNDNESTGALFGNIFRPNKDKGTTIDGNPPAPESGPMKKSSPKTDDKNNLDSLVTKIDDITSSLRDILDSSRTGGFGVSIRNFDDFRNS